VTSAAFADSLIPSSIAIQSMLADEAKSQPWRADVIAARRGDQSAFASLVRSIQRPVYGLCLRLLRSEAEASEVAQEAFLRAYQHLHRYDENRPFDLWVMAIARNLCLDLLRRRTRMKSEDVDEMRETLPSGAKSQEQGAIDREERLSLERALSTLSTEDREVLALYYVQKRTTKEIAQVIGVAPGTIMARLFRAREKLRKQMIVGKELA
jgi:RNA polymerase sigma-70 factor (ECF subfamily)